MLNRREFLAVGSGLATAPALGSQVLASRGSQPSRSSPTTLLFWDDYYLNRRENLKRRVGQPELVPEATFEEPNFWISSGYPTVFRHESGVWRMLYNGKSSFPDEQGQYSHDRFPLLAESDDGIRWRTPDLTRRVPLPDRRFPHQVMPVDEFGQWDCYFDERAEDPNERVKGLVMLSAGERTGLWTSPDGLSWKRVAGVQWRAGENIDPPSTAFWNEVRQSYVISARPSRRLKRVVAFSETTDWRHFTDEELVLLPDAQDTPLAELYGLVAFPYAGKFIGLLWIYHTEPKSLNKYWEGTTDCQLAYSYNGWHFQRSLREAFMPNTAPGELGGGVVRPHCMLVDDDDQIRIYSSSSSLEHGYHIHDHIGRKRVIGPGEGKDKGAILMHRLRLDGFFYLQSNAGPGMLGTVPLLWRGGEVSLNVQSGHEVRVQVTDIEGKPFEGYRFADCDPFKGNQLFWTPGWKGGRGLKEFTKKAIRLEVELNNARIYAMRGDFTALASGEARVFLATGKEPVHRPGFR